jgi:hypothetical protein
MHYFVLIDYVMSKATAIVNGHGHRLMSDSHHHYRDIINCHWSDSRIGAHTGYCRLPLLGSWSRHWP